MSDQTLDRMARALEERIIKEISAGNFTQVAYNDRLKVDPELIQGAWRLVDRQRVIARMAERIESHVADSIFNAMATERANDAKQIMSNRERCKSRVVTP